MQTQISSNALNRDGSERSRSISFRPLSVCNCKKPVYFTNDSQQCLDPVKRVVMFFRTCVATVMSSARKEDIEKIPWLGRGEGRLFGIEPEVKVNRITVSSELVLLLRSTNKPIYLGLTGGQESMLRPPAYTTRAIRETRISETGKSYSKKIQPSEQCCEMALHATV